ncbi:hypothetical protein TVAG_378030 [Trichomonas vaginalis G3]|uniref:Uncharacterized protein n=1 Tax=Trichomonas vaginalis (strain ATCC PRA-98 / G3) TaxID=412133 RepID=A2DAZ4_TRIV3|nr:quinoprotein alcohol dehydrogenase-like family [Trichomonas vaginalis G3]EAY22324.1 hypothetical protein TVAG_378030 [Trichomonas vaginalis G3]KAI5518264.1 quinoprotein alcohol dehydrogenase-like family [Trichomonas vaginalis G3]|eukprot:XP_001583310.1 hypothetical protein [Trichomonas vaginalis G3]
MEEYLKELIQTKKEGSFTNDSYELIAEGGEGLLYLHFKDNFFRIRNGQTPEVIEPKCLTRVIHTFISNCDHTKCIIMDEKYKIDIFELPSNESIIFKFVNTFNVREEQVDAVKWTSYSPNHFVVLQNLKIYLYDCNNAEKLLEFSLSAITSMQFGTDFDPWYQYSLLALNSGKLVFIRGFIPKTGLSMNPETYSRILNTLNTTDKQLFQKVAVPNGSSYNIILDSNYSPNQFEVKLYNRENPIPDIDSFAVSGKYLFIISKNMFYAYELDLSDGKRNLTFVGHHVMKDVDMSDHYDFKYVCEAQIEMNSKILVRNGRVFVFSNNKIWMFNELENKLLLSMKFNGTTIKSIGVSSNVHAFALVTNDHTNYSFLPVFQSCNSFPGGWEQSTNVNSAADKISQRITELKKRKDQIENRKKEILKELEGIHKFVEDSKKNSEEICKNAQIFTNAAESIIEKAGVPQKVDIDEEIKKMLGDDAKFAYDAGKIQTSMLSIELSTNL